MTNKRLAVMLAAVLALLIGGGAVFTLAQGKTAPTPTTTAAPAAAEPELPYPEGGGTLILRVNPEFAIHYDAQGKVVGVDELNDDARAMALDLASYEGQECRAAVSALIAKIKDAGYIVEEVENETENSPRAVALLHQYIVTGTQRSTHGPFLHIRIFLAFSAS